MDWFLNLGASKLVIAGREVVQNDLLADGGFAYVYKGADARTGEKLAIRRVILQEKEAIEKNRAEIFLLQSIPAHPNIVRFLGADIVKSEAAQGTSECISLFELCTGGTLLSRLEGKVAALQPGAKKAATIGGSTRSVVAAGGGQAPVQAALSCCPCLPEGEVLDFLLGISSALAHLHGVGIVHYDVKSENLLLGSDDQWKLGDFGSASKRTFDLADAERRLLLEAQEFIHGRFTPIYRPPEVADVYLRWPIGPKADIFALGCVLFAALTGVHPFPMDSALGNIQAKFTIPPEADLSYSRALPRWVRRALARDPLDRPSAAELASEIEHFMTLGTDPPDVTSSNGPAASTVGSPPGDVVASGTAIFPAAPNEDWVADFSMAPTIALAGGGSDWVADFATALEPHATAHSADALVQVGALQVPDAGTTGTHSQRIPDSPSHQNSCKEAELDASDVVASPSPVTTSTVPGASGAMDAHGGSIVEANGNVSATAFLEAESGANGCAPVAAPGEPPAIHGEINRTDASIVGSSQRGLQEENGEGNGEKEKESVHGPSPVAVSSPAVASQPAGLKTAAVDVSLDAPATEQHQVSPGVPTEEKQQRRRRARFPCFCGRVNVRD